MKKDILIIISIFFILSLSSCLTANTEVIDEYSDNYISDVVGVWYRYVTTESDNSTREVVRKVELDGIQKTINRDERTVIIKVAPSVPIINSIPLSARSGLSINNIAVVVAVPVAARLFPVENAPKLGTNGDWSKPNKYIVEAANGDKAEWTIQIIEFDL
jgi:hypothetical protein